MSFYFKSSRERSQTINFISDELERVSKVLAKCANQKDNTRTSILINVSNDLEEYSEILNNISRSKSTDEKIKTTWDK